MLGDPFSRQASSTYSTACSPLIYHFKMLLSKSPVTFTLPHAQPLQVSVSLDTESPAHLQIPSALTFEEPHLLLLLFLHRPWSFGLLFVLLHLPKALTAGAPGHEPQSFAHLHLCSFCGSLILNHGITVAAGKCTGHHPLLPGRLSSHLPL